MDGWYYKLFSIECGPIAFEKLVELIKIRTLSRDDDVRFGERGAWRKIGSIGPLMAHLPFEAVEKVVSENANELHSVANRGTSSFEHNLENDPIDIDFGKSVSFAKSNSTPLESDFANILDSAETADTRNSSESDNRWWYNVQGREFGPVDLLNLIELIKNRQLKRNDEVRFGDIGNWRRVGSIGQLMAHLPFEPTETTVLENNKNQFATTGRPAPTHGQRSHHKDSDKPLPKAAPISKPKSTAETDSFAVLAAETAESIDIVNPKKPDYQTQKTDSRWWCIIQGTEYGPVDLPKLMDWAATGRLRRDSHVRYGIEPYALAGELPGLFPKLPDAAPEDTSDNETKDDGATESTEADASASGNSVTPTVSDLARMAASLQKIVSEMSLREESPENRTGSQTPRPSPYSASTEFSAPKPIAPQAPAFVPNRPGAQYPNAFSQSGSVPVTRVKPAAPVPSRARKSSGSSVSLNGFLPVLYGVGGLLLLGVLIFAGMQLIPASTGEEIRRLKLLQDGYSKMQKLRDAGGKPTEADLKEAQDAILAATKTVGDELKKTNGKNSFQESLKRIASKMKVVASTDYDETQPSTYENDVSSLTKKLRKDLGLN